MCTLAHKHDSSVCVRGFISLPYPNPTTSSHICFRLKHDFKPQTPKPRTSLRFNGSQQYLHPLLAASGKKRMTVLTLEPGHHSWATGKHMDSSPRAFQTCHNHSWGNEELQPWDHAISFALDRIAQLTPLHWWRRASETLEGHHWSTLQQTW